MKIIIAPDSFKETLTASQASAIIADAFKLEISDIHCITMPLADGGEGTARTLTDALQGTVHYATVLNAEGDACRASFGVVSEKKCAFVDCASAIGLEKISRTKRNPLAMSSYGFGLFLQAVHRYMHRKYGSHHIVVGLGGSATVDGGIGFAQALGVRICDTDGIDVPRGGCALMHVASVDTSNAYAFKDCTLSVAVDVQNPLIGPSGAVRVFAPQKGATATMVEELEQAMNNYAQIVHRSCTSHNVSLQKSVNFSGAGAAGGLGMALSVFCNATVQSGIETVLRYCEFDTLLDDADFVITGEGKIDGQSLYGKVPYGVLCVANKKNVPVIMIGGAVSKDANALYKKNVCAIFSCTLESAEWDHIRTYARSHLHFTARSVARLISRIHT